MSSVHYIHSHGIENMKDEREAWGDVLADSNIEDINSVPVPGAQAIWKGLSILRLISDAKSPIKFSELLTISGLPKGTLHRLLQALIEFKFVRLDEAEQTYKLGHRLFEMAHKVWNEFDLRGAAEPELVRLKVLSNETTRLGVLADSDILVIDQVDTMKPLRLEQGVGKRVSLNASAMGKAIMAHLSPAKVKAYVASKPFEKFTENTIVNLEEFERHLDLTKARGYAVSIEEQCHGVSSVAAPILDFTGNPIGAVAITGGTYSLEPQKLHSLGREVIQAARRISGNVGQSFMSVGKLARPKRFGRSDWTCVAASEAFLGEAPHWNVNTNCLEWVDILEPSAKIFDPSTESIKSIQLEEIIGALVPRTRGGHAAVTQFGYRAVDLEKASMKPLAAPKDFEGKRFNDGKCDAKGRFWAGTLALDASPSKGELYCLESDGTLKKVLDNLHISNGLGWNADSTIMYLTDSGKRTIYAFDFELASGTLSNQRVFAQLDENEGSPDGLAVDMEGGVWSVIWDGWKIIRYDKNGVIDRVVDLPVPRPTSCAFGGPNMSTLYVTSARIRLSAGNLAEAPLSGSIFAIETDVAGVPVSQFAG